MNMWFVVAYLVLGVIGFGLIGMVTLCRVAERECGVNLDMKLATKAAKTEEIGKDPVKDALDDFAEEVDECLAFMPTWKRIGRIVLAILVWPVMIPYALVNLDNTLDVINYLHRTNRHFE